MEWVLDSAVKDIGFLFRVILSRMVIILMKLRFIIIIKKFYHFLLKCFKKGLTFVSPDDTIVLEREVNKMDMRNVVVTEGFYGIEVVNGREAVGCFHDLSEALEKASKTAKRNSKGLVVNAFSGQRRYSPIQVERGLGF